MPCPGPGGDPRSLCYRKWLGGRVIKKSFLEEVKPLLSPGRRRKRKVELGGVEEECLGRGNSTEKAPRPEATDIFRKHSVVHLALSRVLGERREIGWARTRV